MEAAQQKPNRENVRALLCAFFLPGILMLTVFAAIGIYPFGEKSLLIIDMNSEYVDYLAQMNESLRTGGSLLRSWNMGMGLGMLGLIAFYAASPFNLLVMLFPVEMITEALLAVTLLKLGLAGLLFALYTGYTINRRGLFAVLFSVAYALCAYNVAYASNIMWLDGAAFLPLVLLGVEKLLRENRCGLLLFGLVYVFFTSYYIGYMIGVFSLLYMTAVWFSRPRPVREYWFKAAKLAGTAVLAAGCCAFLLLPAFLNLRDGQSEMWTAAAPFTLEKSLVRIASRLLPGVYDTLTDSGYPNIYCTLPGLLLCIAYFAHRKIPRREKLVFGGLLAFLLLSFSCAFLDLAWHAFEDPTWFPARYSFVFSFLMLFLAMRAADRMDSLSPVGAAAALGILALLIVEVGVGRYRYVGPWSLIAAALLAGLYALLWLARRGRWKRWAAPVALLLVCAEVWVNAFAMERELDLQFEYKSREGYAAFRESMAPAVEHVRQADGGVYRLEIAEQRNANGGMMLGYNGISHYSTTTDQKLNAFLRRLGYNKGTDNELRFAPATPLTGGLLGIRYVLSAQDMGGGYRLRGSVGEVGIYENAAAFPLAFWADEGALAFRGETADSADPFALQNELLYALGEGNGFFSPIPDVQSKLTGVDREQEEEFIQYTPRVRGESATVEYQLHNPAGQELYAYFPVWKSHFAGADILVDGKPARQDLRYRNNTVIPLGSGETVTVTLKLGQQPARIAGEYFYALDMDAARSAAATAQERAMTFDRFGDTLVEGRVDAPRDGILVTTFPLDRGWQVRVDGQPAQLRAFSGVFLAVTVPEGSHRIEMRYRPPGFLAGCAVSGACAVGILGWALLRKRISVHVTAMSPFVDRIE